MTRQKMIDYAKRYRDTEENYQIYEAYKAPSIRKIMAFIDIKLKYQAELRKNGCTGCEPKVIAKNTSNFTVGYWVLINEPYQPTFVVITKNYEYRYCDLSEEFEIIKR